MPYLSISDFKFGIDRRRPRAAGTPGTLWVCKNAHITRGGDIERAKKFVLAYTLPSGTFGLSQVSGQLYAFGSADLAGSMPAGVQYQRLTSGGLTMTKLLDVRPFDGKFYVVAQYSDGSIRHFYNGSEITAWQTTINSSSVASLTSYLAEAISADANVFAVANGTQVIVTARNPGTAFTISASVTNNGGDNTQTITVTTPQVNVPGANEVRATGTLTITNGTDSSGVNQVLTVKAAAVDLIASPVNWTVSNSTTALAVAQAINAQSSAHGYAASAVGPTVTIQAPVNVGATANGTALTFTVNGNVTASTVPFAGGVTKTSAVAQVSVATIGGLYEAADEYVITINGTAYRMRGSASGAGTHAFVFKNRIYSTANTIYRYCKLNDPSDWTDALAGFINMASQSEGSERLLCSAVYNSQVAIFSRRSVRIWQIETDPAQNQYLQTLENTGCLAARSVVPFGNVDVFYLSDAGIRSLKAREVSNAAYVSDVGTAIDPFVREFVASVPRQTVRDAVAAIEPIDGRYWLAIADRIFVLSFFPGSNITAWSTYEVGLSFTDFARVEDRIYARAGDSIYLYGGISGAVYPDAGEQIVTVETPFMDAQTPATFKRWRGFDITCANAWAVDLIQDPNRDSVTLPVGTVTKISAGEPHIQFPARNARFALRFTCDKAGYASVSNMQIHYDVESAEAR